MPIPFDNSYARLPDRFFAKIAPTPVRAPALLRVNDALAEALGIDPAELHSPEGVANLAGNGLFSGSDPIALAYAGHQFGGFSPQLGDGRAILIGEVVGPDGVRRDVQLKGSGPTPFSRRGDGRAALGPVLREYLVSESMHALGVPTTRALAAVSTGELVLRGDDLPGAVLTRVAASHLRVGTFEYFAARRDREALATLVDYAIARHEPSLAREGSLAARTLAFLDGVIGRQASLVARWMGLGFVHGVMNTDNTSISGETIDYGPCAFLDAFDPGRTFSSIDQGGRYAFHHQPRIALWNLARLAETLLPLLAEDEAEAIRLATARLDTFPDRFGAAHHAILRAKLGLGPSEGDAHEGDDELAKDLLELMAKAQVDFTLTFRRLFDAIDRPARTAVVSAMFADPRPFDAWAARWRERLARDAEPIEARKERMRLANPAFIARNHRVEQMIALATDGDLSLFERMLRVLARPCDDQPDDEELMDPPGLEQWDYRTFCGT
ncbi:MAG: YdiU family protein [Sandaracinaceae bacterium]|nr:YdiU family protein [Sandaracinaceae bacterium]